MLLPSAEIHSFANNCPLYFVKYNFGLLVYNDDSFVYAARLEDHVLDDFPDDESSENLSSRGEDSDIDLDIDSGSDVHGADQAEADLTEESRQYVLDAEGEMEELEEKATKDLDNTNIGKPDQEIDQDSERQEGGEEGGEEGEPHQDKDMEEVVADASL